jgi:uncharacterized membrane protein YedE/YeeE
MKTFTAFLAGLVFGIGLLVSGMANPAKVIGFLDLAGPWDPSLALVMAGAIGVALGAFAIADRRTTSFLGEAMQLPKPRQIDHRLLAGSALFGIGWGIAGICPGPALVVLGMGVERAPAFVLSMVAGMVLYAAYERSRAVSTPRRSG